MQKLENKGSTGKKKLWHGVLAKLRPNIPVIAVIAYQAVSYLSEEECEAGLKTKSQLYIYK